VWAVIDGKEKTDIFVLPQYLAELGPQKKCHYEKCLFRDAISFGTDTRIFLNAPDLVAMIIFPSISFQRHSCHKYLPGLPWVG